MTLVTVTPRLQWQFLHFLNGLLYIRNDVVRVTLAYSDTFCWSQGCHCKRGCLYKLWQVHMKCVLGLMAELRWKYSLWCLFKTKFMLFERFWSFRHTAWGKYQGQSSIWVSTDLNSGRDKIVLPSWPALKLKLISISPQHNRIQPTFFIRDNR